MSSCRETIIKMAAEGGVRSPDLYALGFSRSTVENALRRLVLNGKIFKRGHARAAFYTADPDAPDVPVVHPGQRSRSYEAPLPDLPDNILLMMGYTRHKPTGGYKIYGGAW